MVKQKRALFICNGHNKITDLSNIHCAVTDAKYYDERTKEWKNGKAVDTTQILSIEIGTLQFSVSMNWLVARALGHKQRVAKLLPFMNSDYSYNCVPSYQQTCHIYVNQVKFSNSEERR